LDGVDFVHKKGIAHRDLKLENCFLNKDVTLKVADFGMAKAFEGPNGKDLSTRCGTLNYMAPELLKNSVSTYDG
jgi:serine/threonine protein kinase